jgi:hypothetical protein
MGALLTESQPNTVRPPRLLNLSRKPPGSAAMSPLFYTFKLDNCIMASTSVSPSITEGKE